MPVRATARGDDRTDIGGEHDVVVCGASFAGLAVARELSGSGKDVLLVDRYEIGEKQTSACAAPTLWLENLGLTESIRQTFDTLVIHRRNGSSYKRIKSYRWKLPWTFSTFDYPQLCALLKEQSPDVAFATATVEGRDGDVVRTDRGQLRAPLIVDALGWRRVLSNGRQIQPPKGRLSRGLEVHPHSDAAPGKDLEIWLDPKYVRPGYSWSFPAGDELRVGVGSFDPNIHVKEPTLQLCEDVGVEADGWQGNWIPHQLRDATEDGVFFCGDSAGHCLPTTAEGIRTALYFGLACGRELRAVLDGRQTREQALTRYGSFSADHAGAYRGLLWTQTAISGAMSTPMLDHVLNFLNLRGKVDWAFTHYLNIAPPSFALESTMAFESPPFELGAPESATPALSA